jgi:hypothetical protein
MAMGANEKTPTSRWSSRLRAWASATSWALVVEARKAGQREDRAARMSAWDRRLSSHRLELILAPALQPAVDKQAHSCDIVQFPVQAQRSEWLMASVSECGSRPAPFDRLIDPRDDQRIIGRCVNAVRSP